jgi:predicted tellurium resistance membrane protein TerC
MDLVQDFQQLFTLSSLVSLLTLTVLEIVLGIDNIIFIAIIAGKLPREQQGKARATGLTLALLFRIGLLLSIKWILGMKDPLLTVFGFEATGRDIILFCGGIFLLVKTIGEIHNKVEGKDEGSAPSLKAISLRTIILQIVFIDIVFSFDSILTAVSIVSNVLIMIGAVILSMILMLISSEKVSDFINRHPTIKMLALSFLLMVAIILIMDAAHINVDQIKPYLYFSMGFAFIVELLNMRMRKVKRRRGK